MAAACAGICKRSTWLSDGCRASSTATEFFPASLAGKSAIWSTQIVSGGMVLKLEAAKRSCRQREQNLYHRRTIPDGLLAAVSAAESSLPFLRPLGYACCVNRSPFPFRCSFGCVMLNSI
jgi:hypothetical protein